MNTKLRQRNRLSWFRFSKIHNFPGECLSIIATHVCWVPVCSVSATKASCSTLCSTSASTNLSPNVTFLVQLTRPQLPRCCHISKFREHLFLRMRLWEHTPDHCHRYPRRQGLQIARFCFTLASVPLISSPPSLWSKMTLPSSSESSPVRSSSKSRLERPGTPRLTLHPYRNRDKFLCERKHLTFEQKIRQELEHEHSKTT